MDRIQGIVSEIIFEGENGFKICTITTSDSNGFGENETVLRGTMPFLNVGEFIVADGNWDTHNVYGMQFIVKSFEKHLPSEISDIKAFLASGLIEGIAGGLAGRIVDKFGTDTFDVIMYQPDLLRTVQGISPKKVAKISEAFRTHKESSESVMFFARFGIGTGPALNAYKMYGNDAANIAAKNPYKLADEIRGITFEQADSMALQLGFLETSPERIMACIIKILNSAYNAGHVFLPKQRLFESVKYYAENITEELFNTCLTELSKIRRIIIAKVKTDEESRIDGDAGDIGNEDDAGDADDVGDGFTKVIYLSYMFEAERYIESRLKYYSAYSKKCSDRIINKTIDLFERENNITLAENQREAVKLAANNGVTIITGGPGVGKTTLIKAIIRVSMAEGEKCLLAAPTGRAAKRMSAACNVDAKTIHRLLELDFQVAAASEGDERDDRTLSFKRNEMNPLDCDCLIIDEASMIDTILMYHLLKAVRPGTRLILVGDKDQLPSVGPGRILKDIIESGRFVTVTLNDIYRQSGSSLIPLNAKHVNLGEMPEMNDVNGDFFLLRRDNAEMTIRTVQDLVTKRLPAKYHIDPMKDIQVIIPNKKGNTGTMIMNKALQNVLNPDINSTRSVKVGDSIFREGDRVMQIKNNYTLIWEGLYNASITGEGVFNGEMGVIGQIDTKNKIVSVIFDETRLVFYDFTTLHELEHCYAVTVHKSQGSEFDYCVIPIVNVTPTLRTRNLLYTAITRAKKLVVIVGTEETIRQMIDNDKEELRFSGLFKDNKVVF